MTQLLVFSSVIFPVGAFAFIVLVVAAISSRGEPDPTGRRPYAAYLFIVSFLALFTVVFAGFATLSAIAHLATRDSGSTQTDSSQSDSSQSDSGGTVTGTISNPETGEPIIFGGSRSTFSSTNDDEQDNADIRSAVQSGLVMIVAGLVLAFHAGRARRLVLEPGFLDSPSRRIYQAYLYAVCFLAVITALGALAAAGYGVFRAVAPGIASPGGSDGSKKGLTQLFTAGALSLAALLVFFSHWRRAEAVLDGGTAPPAAPEPRAETSEPPPPQ